MIKTTLLACLLGASFIATAQDAPKGWLVVRGGVPNADANYTNEERDINDNLERVSVLCGKFEDSPAGIQAITATDRTRNWAGPRAASSTTTVINQKGKVVKDPLDNNPNHCLINGLPLSKIKGIWH
jgi:hypothetical protein